MNKNVIKKVLTWIVLIAVIITGLTVANRYFEIKERKERVASYIDEFYEQWNRSYKYECVAEKVIKDYPREEFHITNSNRANYKNAIINFYFGSQGIVINEGTNKIETRQITHIDEMWIDYRHDVDIDYAYENKKYKLTFNGLEIKNGEYLTFYRCEKKNFN